MEYADSNSCPRDAASAWWLAGYARYVFATHTLGAFRLGHAGISLVLPCGPRLLFGRLGNILTDGDGFRWTLQINELQQQSDK